MAPFLPELRAALAPDVQLDGVLVALDDSSRPDFHLLGARMQRRPGAHLTYFVFGVLAVDVYATSVNTYEERRACWRRSTSNAGPCDSSPPRGR